MRKPAPIVQSEFSSFFLALNLAKFFFALSSPAGPGLGTLLIIEYTLSLPASKLTLIHELFFITVSIASSLNIVPLVPLPTSNPLDF